MRYEYDTRGRIVGTKPDGVTPRFVLGRSAEGCVWRFAACVETQTVRQVAKLAGREPGFPIDQESSYLPPERLVMIERILNSTGSHSLACAGVGAVRELVTRNSVTLGEIWILE